MMAYLYVITIGEGFPVKIGITSNLQARIRQLKTSCPKKPEFFAIHCFVDRATAYRLERAVHLFLRDLRSSGEWFDIDPMTANSVIEGVASYEGIR